MSGPPPPAARAAWTALAVPLAARNSMRVWRGPDCGYDQARKLATVNLPSLPAALPLYNKAGWTRVLALDFDTKLGCARQVEDEAAEVAELVAAVGGRVIVDLSPSGGRHLWVPLWAEHRLNTLMPLLQGMRARWHTLDTSPMTNPSTGCLTGPGSPCIGGGHRELVTPISEATDALRQRCEPGTLGVLRRAVNAGRTTSLHQQPTDPELPRDTRDTHGAKRGDTRGDTVRPPASPQPDDAAARPRTVADVLSPAAHAFATTGQVPVDRPGWTRSEARMCVLTQSARAGLSLEQIQDLIDTGRWAGLAAAYAKYGRRWTVRLNREWDKVTTLLATQDQKSQHPEHKQTITGGMSWQRHWLAQSLRWLTPGRVPGHSPATVSAVLQAIGHFSWLRESRTVAPGGRWLSIAAGMLTEATVWTVLRALSALDEGPIRLVERHHGPHADTYELVTPRIHGEPVVVTPDEVTRVCPRQVPAVWRVIGHCARETFELIETLSANNPGRVRKSVIKQIARTGDTTVDTAIARLAEFGLIETGWGWVERTQRSLADVARAHRVAEHVAQRIARHRAERQTWQSLLRLWVATLATECPQAETLPDDPMSPAQREGWLGAVMRTGPPPDPFEPSTEERQLANAVEMFRSRLDATMVSHPPSRRATALSACDHARVNAFASTRWS